jgi:YD repeat-containing protein
MVDFDYADSTGRYLASVKEFDLNNNIVKEIGYRPDGWIENHYTNKYNDKNQRIEHSIFDEDNQLMETHKFDYDEAGKIIGEACYYAEMDDKDYTHFIYDEDGLLIEKRNMDSDNELYTLIKFTYTDKLMTHEEHFSDEMKLESEKVFEYNSEGKLITEMEMDHLEKDKHTHKYEYDEAGHRTKSLFYNKKDQLAIKSVFEYDDQGQNVALIDEDVHGITITRYTFNDDGQMELQEKFNAEEELLVKWVYEYSGEELIKTTTFIREESENKSDESEEEHEMVKRVTTEHEYEFFE